MDSKGPIAKMDFKTRLEFQGIALHGRRVGRVLQDFDVLIDGRHLLIHGFHELFQVWHNLPASVQNGNINQFRTQFCKSKHVRTLYMECWVEGFGCKLALFMPTIMSTHSSIWFSSIMCKQLIPSPPHPDMSKQHFPPRPLARASAPARHHPWVLDPWGHRPM